jgi:hypothetical protein
MSDAEKLAVAVRALEVAARMHPQSCPCQDCLIVRIALRTLAAPSPEKAETTGEAWRQPTTDEVISDMRTIDPTREPNPYRETVPIAPTGKAAPYWNPNTLQPACETTWAALREELSRARAKFPGNRRLFVALAEEVGELAKALLQRDPEWRKEALQVACVAIRIFEETDRDFDDVTDEEAQP